MPSLISESRRAPGSFFLIAGFAILLSLFYWFLWGDIGIRFDDEGFLWYGSVMTADGQIPLRDFQSYDPGRYYWVAFWMMLFGKGILGVRLALLVFQGIAFACLFKILNRVIKSWPLLLGIGLIISFWMYPSHKAIDISLSIMSVYAALLLLESPTWKRYFGVGVFIGLSAFFGRNHGFYNLTIFSLLFVFIFIKIDRTKCIKKLIHMLAGIFVGYLPMIAMFIVVPGFWNATLDTLLRMFELKTTNLTLPIPWPWRVDYSLFPSLPTVQASLTSLLFLAAPIYYLFLAVFLKVKKAKIGNAYPILVATFLVGIVYLHVAFSMAALGHLAQGIHPLLIGGSVLGYRYCRKPVARTGFSLGLILATVFSVGLVTPRYAYWFNPAGTWQRALINNDRLRILESDAQIINSISAIKRQAGDKPSVMVLPHWPGMYCLIGQKSPIWEIYPILPQRETTQRTMIGQMKANNVDYVVLGDNRLAGREDLRFRNTHPLMYEYITTHYQPIANDGLPGNYEVYRIKN